MSSSVIVLRVELEPLGVSLVPVSGFFSAALYQLTSSQQAAFLCPTIHMRLRDRCSQRSPEYLHIPLERKTKGIGRSAGNGQNFFVHAEVCCSLLWKGATETCCAFLLLPSLLARKVNKGGTVPPRAPLCTGGYTHLVVPSPNLSTLQLLCPCELVLQPPWICFAMSFCQKEKVFP